MRPSDILHYSFKGLRERRLRSSLTILGILVGTALIIALLANANGLSVTITQQIAGLGANNIFLVPASATSSFRPNDAEAASLAHLPGVRSVVPFYQGPVRVQAGGLTLETRVFGVNPLQLNILFPNLRVEEGTPLRSTDIGIIGIGQDIAHPPAHPGASVVIGQSVTLQGVARDRGRSVLVGSVYERFGATLFFDVDSGVLMSLPAAASFFGSTTYHGLIIETLSPEAVPVVTEQLRLRYGAATNIISPTSILQSAQTILASFTLFLGAIAAIALFVAGIGIANTMVMSVMERTREIGVLRALGFTRRAVTLLFLSEAVLTGALGGVLGVGTGSALALALGRLFGSFAMQGGPGGPRPIPYSPLLTADLLVSAFLFAALIGAAAGVYPARKAASLDPVKALRTE